jgi:hypothetical protein
VHIGSYHSCGTVATARWWCNDRVEWGSCGVMAKLMDWWVMGDDVCVVPHWLLCMSYVRIKLRGESKAILTYTYSSTSTITIRGTSNTTFQLLVRHEGDDFFPRNFRITIRWIHSTILVSFFGHMCHLKIWCFLGWTPYSFACSHSNPLKGGRGNGTFFNMLLHLFLILIVIYNILLFLG